MRDAQKILGIINKRGKHQKPINKLYRQLYNPNLYLEAYKNIYANKGALTKGANNDTADGMSKKKIETIIAKLKSETYRWTPVRRIYKDKDKGKKRPLGLPSWSDKLLQEVIRMLLDAFFDCQFSEDSHGFRPNRGCKTALEAIGRNERGWIGTKWLLEGDISRCFESIDHQILLNILVKSIADKRFLRLIENYLKCGYMEDWKYHKTLEGCPQGGILSPLLSNIYMDQFDKYVKNVIKPKYNKGKRRANNKEYTAIINQKQKYKRHGNWDKVKELKRLSHTMSAQATTDPCFKRLHFTRYADDWLIGLIGSKKEAQAIKTELSLYLARELKLELNQEKTLITNARHGEARFLGYDIDVMHSDTKHRNGRRTINGKIRLKVPKDKIQAKIGKYMAKGKPTHRAERIVDSDYDIVSQYQAEYLGFVQYYLPAFNAHSLHLVRWVMETSLAKTLAAKHKTTVSKIFRKYKTTIETVDGPARVLQVEVKREGKDSLFAHFGGIRLVRSMNYDVAEAPKQIFNVRSQLIDRLMRDVCELCGSSVEVEMHHVKKLKNLHRMGRREKPEWMKRMIAMKRKTLAVCGVCHHLIHVGRYDGVRVC
jgi:group II intron reverse transcriptase/maturase